MTQKTDADEDNAVAITENKNSATSARSGPLKAHVSKRQSGNEINCPTKVTVLHAKECRPLYKTVFAANSFELGEDCQFKRRVFTFMKKPTAAVIEALMAAGFASRASGKSWTIRANETTRPLSDDLAARFAKEDS